MWFKKKEKVKREVEPIFICKVLYTSEEGIKETKEYTGFSYLDAKVMAGYFIEDTILLRYPKRTMKQDGTGIYYFNQIYKTAEILPFQD
jgi:hypothetical protein